MHLCTFVRIRNNFSADAKMAMTAVENTAY